MEYYKPIFTANQPLRFDDLNNLINYLYFSDQEQRTLLGKGIIYGLYPSIEQKDNEYIIKITKGLGLTSDGLTIKIDEDLSFYCYEKIYLKDLEIFLNITDSIKVKKLIKNDDKKNDNKICIIEKKDYENAKNMFVIALLKLNKNQNNLDQSFDNYVPQGSVENMSVDFYLLNSDEIKQQKVNVELNDIKVGRIEHTIRKFSFIETISNDRFFSCYYGLCFSILKQLREVFTQSHEQFDNYKEKLEKLLEILKYLNKNAETRLQYFYHFLLDLVRIYQDLKIALSDFDEYNKYQNIKFPKHLLIGKLDRSNTSYPDEFRYPFSPSQIFANLNNDKFHFLYSFFLFMLDREKEDFLDDDKSDFYFLAIAKLLHDQYFRLLDFYFHTLIQQRHNIKVTPSLNPSYPVNERAVPFYYNISDNKEIIRHFWKSYANYNCLSDTQENKNLPFNSDFLLIEGHLGKPESEVKGIIDKYDLPFNCVVVDLLNSGDHPLRRFLYKYKDIESKGGVNLGGTLVLVVSQLEPSGKSIVIADFCLPYLLK